MKKAFSAIEVLVIIAIIILLGGVYYLTQNKATQLTTTDTKATTDPAITTIPETTTTTEIKDETADWKTYTNTKYGYIFKYPATNQAPEDEGIGGTKAEESQVLHVYLTNTAEQTSDLTMVRVTATTLSPTDQKLPLADYIKSVSKQVYTTSNVKVGNETAIKVNYTTGSYTIKDASGQTVVNGSGSDVRFIKNGDSIYMIEPNANGTKTGNPILADQVLSTFKLTK